MITSLLLALLGGDPVRTVTLQTPEDAHEPQVAVESPTGKDDVRVLRPDGIELCARRVYVAYGTRDAVFVSVSEDCGASFGHPVQVAKVGSLALGMRRGPRIAISGGSVVITAIAGERGGGRDGDLLSWRSTDAGKSWSPGERINEVVGSAREGLHAMAAGLEDRLFCSWIDLGTDAPRICGSLSTDGGRNWGPTRVLCADSEAICPCCQPSVALGGNGWIHVMWRGQANGARDMVLAVSKDGGQNFSAPTKLGQGTWKLSACPMDGGALVALPGRVVSVWRRENRIYRAERNGPEGLLGEGEQPWAACGPAGICFVWVEKRGGRLLLSCAGATKPVELAPEASDPAIGAAGFGRGPMVVVWESGTGPSSRIVAARVASGAKED
jgi:hypothetical protein